MSTSVHAQQPTWLDTNAYPFTSQFLELPAGRMHYVDEGQGEVLLFVHGTPTWSFLYRSYIRELSKTYRCIALDNLGFGLSEKPEGLEGTPEQHAEHLHALIEHLELENITLVVHDFGGPIGLSYAVAHPDKISRIVLFNTWLWETASLPDAQRADRLVRSGLGRFLYLRMNLSPRVLLKKGFHDSRKLTRDVHRYYTRVFPTKTSRHGLLRLAESLVGSSDWYQAQWERLDVLEEKPWLILWGTEDPFLHTEFLERWKQRLPHAEVHSWSCGHFVQEERPEESLDYLRLFLQTHVHP